MRQQQLMEWLRARHSRASAWGAWLDDRHILLACLALQTKGLVRVAAFEQQHVPAGLLSTDERDSWLVQQLRMASAHLPRRERILGLALHECRCRQGVYQPSAGLSPPQLVAEVQLEAASALGVAPEAVGFDFEPVSGTDAAPPQIQWAACVREELEHWRGHARRSGWRLPMVETEHQAARRAACCLRGDALAHWAQSPQDWQFERLPARSLDESVWQVLQTSPQWGPLVACGAALGLMA